MTPEIIEQGWKWILALTAGSAVLGLLLHHWQWKRYERRRINRLIKYAQVEAEAEAEAIAEDAERLRQLAERTQAPRPTPQDTLQSIDTIDKLKSQRQR